MKVNDSRGTEVSVLYEDSLDFVSVHLIRIDKQSLVCKRLGLLGSVSLDSDGDSICASPLYESFEVICFLNYWLSPVKGGG